MELRNRAGQLCNALIASNITVQNINSGVHFVRTLQADGRPVSPGSERRISKQDPHGPNRY
jgi:hypothetical protein